MRLLLVFSANLPYSPWQVLPTFETGTVAALTPNGSATIAANLSGNVYSLLRPSTPLSTSTASDHAPSTFVKTPNPSLKTWPIKKTQVDQRDEAPTIIPTLTSLLPSAILPLTRKQSRIQSRHLLKLRRRSKRLGLLVTSTSLSGKTNVVKKKREAKFWTPAEGQGYARGYAMVYPGAGSEGYKRDKMR